jgi:hypothetical protein
VSKNFEERRRRAVLIFDLEDRFAREQGFRGPHPRPIEPITFYLTGQAAGNGGSAPEFEAPWQMLMRRNPSGHHLFFDTVKLPNGAIRQARLPAGNYQVRVESPVYLPQETVVPIPFDPVPYQPIALDLQPNYLYPFALSGSTLLRGYVQDAANNSIENVTVSVTVPVRNGDQTNDEEITFNTDAAGQWILIFPNNIVFPSNGDQSNKLNIQVRFALPDGNITVENATLEKGRLIYLGRTELP